MDWKARVRSAFETFPPMPDDDVIEELAQHVQATYEAARADNYSHDEADRRVTTQLERWRVDAAALRRTPRRPPAIAPLPLKASSPFAGLWSELRHAGRLLARNPAFTAIAALSIALGVGVNSTMFSFHDAILLRPLPVDDPGAVVSVSAGNPSAAPDDPAFLGRMSYPNYRDLREQSRSFGGLIANQQVMLSFARSSEAVREMRLAMLVSENFFSVLGVRPMAGRAFTPGEGSVHGRDAVLVLGYDFWKNTLGADTSIVNRNVIVNGNDFTVIGIAPESFTGIDQFIRPAFYLPLMMAEQLAVGQANRLENREARSLEVRGRLKSGISRQSAEAEMTALWKELERQFPDANRNRIIAIRTQLQERIRANPPNAILTAMMTALAALVLIIACANVANLMLGRARARSREMAIRLALGVSRIRLVRQLLTESLLLALLGGVLGVGFAYGGIRFMSYSAQGIVPSEIPFVVEPHLNGRVLVFSLVATLISAVLFGLAPAWHTLRISLVPALKSTEGVETARRRTVGRNVLVIAQVALSMVLLVAAAMLQVGFRNTLAVDPGFRTDHLMTLTLDTSFTRNTPAQTHNFYRDLVDRARVLPGVRSVALTDAAPLNRGFRVRGIPEGHQFPAGQQTASVAAGIVDSSYFRTMQTAIISGRAFTADDSDKSPRVAIVNQLFAATYWPNQNPIGKRVRLNGSEGPWLEVVGLTRNEKYVYFTEPPTPFLYLPFAQNERPQMSLVVETTDADASSIAAPLRDLVRTLDGNQPVFGLRTFSSFYKMRATAGLLLVMKVTAFMGLLGMTLALVGLYGLVAYSVAQRTREIGIRMAVGAEKAQVLRMILREGMMLSVSGILVGGVASLAVVRLMAAGMAGLGTPSLTAYAVVPVLLIGLTLAASYIPARRAARIDPLRALRYE